MSAPNPSSPTADPGNAPQAIVWDRFRRRTVRIFVVLVVALIAIDTSPGSFKWLQPAKQGIAPWSRRAGLWQGEWPLFAPNPYINNAWLSAEVYDPQGQLQMWNSDYWADRTTWDKFRRFRYMNYYNRLPFRHRATAKDFSDYLARQLISPTAKAVTENESVAEAGQVAAGAAAWELRLYHNQLNLSMPVDGTLPAREETLWISSSVNLTQQEYQP